MTVTWTHLLEQLLKSKTGRFGLGIPRGVAAQCGAEARLARRSAS
jgi:hypothetical protein